MTPPKPPAADHAQAIAAPALAARARLAGRSGNGPPTLKTGMQRIRRGGVFLGLVFIAAVCGYRWLGRDWLDAVYMVVITISTIGYTEHSDLAPAERAFTILVILVGISASAYTLGGFFKMMFEGEIDKALGVRRAAKAIDRLAGHVIICGYGRVGQILAAELQRQDRTLVVIDRDAVRIDQAAVAGHLALSGDATEEGVLESAGIARARTLVTVLPNDAANVFITLTSRNMNPALQIIARGESHSTQKKLLQAGANRVVLPAAIGAQRIASLITHPSAIELMELVAGRSVMDVEIDEVVLPVASPLVGKTVIDTEARRRHGLLVVAVKRAEGQMIFNPDGDFSFAAADTVIVMGKPEDIARFRQDYSVRDAAP